LLNYLAKELISDAIVSGTSVKSQSRSCGSNSFFCTLRGSVFSDYFRGFKRSFALENTDNVKRMELIQPIRVIFAVSFSVRRQTALSGQMPE
jgi:hypothetical protein